MASSGGTGRDTSPLSPLELNWSEGWAQGRASFQSTIQSFEAEKKGGFTDYLNLKQAI